MTLDSLIQLLNKYRETSPGDLPVRMCIDFGRKGQWEAECAETSLVMRYVNGSSTGTPVGVMLIYAGETERETSKPDLG